jgi:hypothetical protein
MKMIYLSLLLIAAPVQAAELAVHGFTRAEVEQAIAAACGACAKVESVPQHWKVVGEDKELLERVLDRLRALHDGRQG